MISACRTSRASELFVAAILKYLGAALQAITAWWKEHQNNETASMLRRYIFRSWPLLRPEGCGWLDILLQFAMLLLQPRSAEPEEYAVYETVL
jgi:hypothetical protein